MNIEQAMKQVEREERMWGDIVAPIKDGLAKQEADLKRKPVSEMDDLEFVVAMNLGIVK